MDTDNKTIVPWSSHNTKGSIRRKKGTGRERNVNRELVHELIALGAVPTAKVMPHSVIIWMVWYLDGKTDNPQISWARGLAQILRLLPMKVVACGDLQQYPWIYYGPDEPTTVLWRILWWWMYSPSRDLGILLPSRTGGAVGIERHDSRYWNRCWIKPLTYR